MNKPKVTIADAVCKVCGGSTIIVRKNKQPRCASCGAFYRLDEEPEREDLPVYKPGTLVEFEGGDRWHTGTVARSPDCEFGVRGHYVVRVTALTNESEDERDWKHLNVLVKNKDVRRHPEDERSTNPLTIDEFFAKLC